MAILIARSIKKLSLIISAVTAAVSLYSFALVLIIFVTHAIARLGS
jgi:hypothetical protein